jgi:hypothetical protein
LFVNNNPSNNGGYRFVEYEWFKNEQSIGTGQYYSAGDNATDVLDETAKYSVTFTTDDGKVLHTCLGMITLQPAQQSTPLKVYPNSAEIGEEVTIEYTPSETLTKDVVLTYDILGNLINNQVLNGSGSKISLPQLPGTYVLKINNETTKVLVK